MSELLERLSVVGLERQVEAFCKFFAAIPSDPANAMHGTIVGIHALCNELQLLPRPAWRSPDVQSVLRPAIELQERSSFVRRLRDWPRGYPGDFETIELLVKGCPVPKSTEAGDWINWYALNTAIGQQHRNKVWWQYLKMQAIAPARILSIGCGGGADFNVAPRQFAGSQIVLLDLDQEALRLAQDRLRHFCDVHTICGDVRRGIRRATDDGPFDIVVCGGLFDYLDDRSIIFVLRELRERAIKMGGTIIFTNVSEENAFRVWMEGVADWRLIHRSEADIRRMVVSAGGESEDLRFSRDATGLTHLVELGAQ